MVRGPRFASVGVVVAFAAATLMGCHTEEVDDKAPAHAVIKFEGAVDPAYVGHWKEVGGLSELDLTADGPGSIIAVSEGPAGKSKRTIKSNWLISGKDLLLQYTAGGSEVVLKQSASLAGDSLTVVQAGNKHKTAYKRS